MQHPKVDHENPPRDNPFVRPRGHSRPIHNIPFELLLRIFKFGAAYDDRPIRAMSTAYKYQLLEEDAGEEPASEFTINTFHTRQSTSIQIMVSHVCRHWRDVAISTPSLWTDIRVSMDTARPPYMLVSLHLERSNLLPIDITVSEHPSNPSPESLYADAKSLYALLIPHIHRWRAVDLFCAKSQNMAAFLATVSSRTTPPASRLESLRLHHHFNDVELYLADPVLSGFRTLFNGFAPRLEHLSLAAVHIEWNQALIAAASNLTSLELFYHVDHVRPSWIEFATILRGAPALEKLTLHKSAPSEHPDDWVFESAATDDDLNAPIPLLHLKELVLGSQPEDVAIGLLQHVYMPALKTLILDLKDGDYSEFVNELTNPATTTTTTTTTTLSNSPPLTGGTPPSLLERLERLAIFNLACEDRHLMSTMFTQLENLNVLRLSPTPDLESDVSLHLLRHLVVPDTVQNAVTTTADEKNALVHTLPHLESLIVSPSKPHIPLLRDFVQRRKDAAAPLRSLSVSFDEFRDWETMRWFRGRVERVSFVEELYCLNTDRAFEENSYEVAGLSF